MFSRLYVWRCSTFIRLVRGTAGVGLRNVALFKGRRTLLQRVPTVLSPKAPLQRPHAVSGNLRFPPEPVTPSGFALLLALNCAVPVAPTRKPDRRLVRAGPALGPRSSAVSIHTHATDTCHRAKNKPDGHTSGRRTVRLSPLAERLKIEPSGLALAPYPFQVPHPCPPWSRS